MQIQQKMWRQDKNEYILKRCSPNYTCLEKRNLTEEGEWESIFSHLIYII